MPAGFPLAPPKAYHTPSTSITDGSIKLDEMAGPLAPARGCRGTAWAVDDRKVNKRDVKTAVVNMMGERMKLQGWPGKDYREQESRDVQSISLQ